MFCFSWNWNFPQDVLTTKEWKEGNDMSNKMRRKFTPEEKVAILKKNLLEKVPVSDLCDQYSLHPTVFYRWLKEFFENGSRAFEKEADTKTLRLEKQIKQLKDKLSKKHVGRA